MNAPKRVKVIIHADAGPLEGWGHLRESLEIAKALRARGADCLLVLPSGSPQASVEAEAQDFDVVTIPARDWQSGGPPDTLQRLINEFVTRDGTDYGSTETPLATRVAQVMRALESGRARVTFDSALQSATIVLDERIPK